MSLNNYSNYGLNEHGRPVSRDFITWCISHSFLYPMSHPAAKSRKLIFSSIQDSCGHPCCSMVRKPGAPLLNHPSLISSASGTEDSCSTPGLQKGTVTGAGPAGCKLPPVGEEWRPQDQGPFWEHLSYFLGRACGQQKTVTAKDR